MNLRKVISFLAFALLLSSCENDIPFPQGMLMPEILSVRSEGSGKHFTLYAELSSPRVDECGFILTPPSGAPVVLSGTLEGQSFSATPTSLHYNSDYTFKAFVKAGGMEILSKESAFSTLHIEGDVDIEDDAFLAYLIENFDSNGDGRLQIEEAEAITSINLGPRGIKSLGGIEYMTSLKTLDCSKNLITRLDVSANLNLTWLDCSPMEDDDHRNLLDALFINTRDNQSISTVTNMVWTRNTQYVPQETIVCVRYDNDPRVGTVVETGGSRGIIFSVDNEQNEALVVSVDEAAGKNWNDSVKWCESYGDGSWWMPDSDQLHLLHRAFYPVTKALMARGLTPLYNENQCYWSSTINPTSQDHRLRELLWLGEIIDNVGQHEHYTATVNRTRAVKKVNL